MITAPTDAVVRVLLSCVCGRSWVSLVLGEFGQVVAPGGACLVISSMAGYMHSPVDTEAERSLAHTSADEQLGLPILAPDAVPNSGVAYALAKRANHLRIPSAAVAWGDRGDRINSISPGIILTPSRSGRWPERVDPATGR